MTHFLQLLLLLALAIVAAKLAGSLPTRIGQPAVFGEILVGLILGPTVLNILGLPLFAAPFDEAGARGASLEAILRDLSEFGVLLLMFVAVVIAMLYAWAAEYVGAIAAITGAYVAGVLIAQTDFKKEIDAGIHPLAYSIFVPVFFIGIGLQANGRVLGDRVLFTMMLIIVAIVTKAVGCWLFAKWCGFTSQQSLRVGIGMISRGEVGLIVAGYGLSNGLIGTDVFSASVIVVLATTMVTPPLLRLVFPRHAAVSATVEETIAHAPQLSK